MDIKINEKFIKKYLKRFLYVVIILTLTIFSLEKYFSKDKISEIEKNYFSWQKSYDKKLLSKIDSDIKKFPYLFSKHNSNILQRRLYENDTDSYKKIEKIVKNKNKNSLLKFSKISLLIERKEFEKALLESEELKRDIVNKKSSLFAINLFRIAFLEKELKNRKKELEALSFLEKYLLKIKNKPFLENFKKGSFTFFDYISKRKKEIL
jgi:hypothetical protein